MTQHTWLTVWGNMQTLRKMPPVGTAPAHMVLHVAIAQVPLKDPNYTQGSNRGMRSTVRK